MRQPRTYRFLIDCVNPQNLPQLTQALWAVNCILALRFFMEEKTLVVQASSDPERDVMLACDAVHARFRVRLGK